MATIVHAFRTGGDTGSITAPAGTTSVKIQTWGAGGGGRYSGWGAGGGAYAEVTLSAAVNDIIYYSVGAGGVGVTGSGNGGNGGDSWGRITTNSAPTATSEGALAKGGNGGDGTSDPGGLGGTTAASIGTTKYAGAGANHSATVEGGGGGAGSGGAGSQGSGGAVGTGGAGGTPDGGSGGAGQNPGTGDAGTAPGGGGSGPGGGGGGDGGDGWVVITFTFTPETDAVTWNPEDADADIVLTNSNLTVDGTGGGFTNAMVRASAQIVGQKYWEVYIEDAGSSLYHNVGIANSEVSLDTYPNSASSTDYFGIQQNNASLPWQWTEDWSGGYNGSANDDTGIIRFAVNETTKKLWWQVGEQGWLPSGDPAAGTGGYDISTITGDWYPQCAMPGAGSTLTAKFASDHWTYSAPSGFTALALPTAVVFDRVNIGDGITLTNGNLTGESRVGGENLSTARSTVALSAGVDYYWEIVADAVYNGNYVIGVVNSTKDLDDWVASGTHDGIGINPDGAIYWDGGNNGPGHTDTWDDGDIVSVHYKRSDETIRFRVNGGTWSAYTDVSTFFTGDTVYAAVNGGAPGNIFTAAFARGDWTYAEPSGSYAIDEAVAYTYTSGTGSVTAPAGTTEARIQTWGAGAGGQASGYGGGGGAYAEVTLTAAENDIVYYSVGAGGTGRADSNQGNPGGDSWGRLNTNSAPTATTEGALADGGIQSPNAGGGTVANSVGTIEYRGGNTANAPSYDGGGGGAGSGGQGGDCTTTNGVAGVGGTPDGGAGGTGVASGTGGAGTAPGGGGGATLSGTGGAGASGQVRITFFFPSAEAVIFYQSNAFQIFPLSAGGGPTIYTLTADFGTYALTGVSATRSISMHAASGAYTYTGVAATRRISMRAAPGSYAQTGVAAGLVLTRRVTADFGTYTQTGVAAGLVNTRRLTADFGTYAQTGYDVTLRAARTLTAAQGSYSLTGVTALFDRSVVTAGGTYALTGVSAGLKRIYTLAAAQGTYAQTGVDAGLDYVTPIRTLTADQGSYSLTGVSVGFDRSVTAAAGTYALTGVSANLSRVYTLTAAVGTYAQTGVATTLRVTRLPLAADYGTYAQTGVDADLLYLSNATLVADAGTYAQTGYDVTLRVIRKVVADYGTYAQSGVAAVLQVTRRVTADQGTYTLTGEAAVLRASRKLVSEQGSYNQTGNVVVLRQAKRMAADYGTYAQTGVSAGFRRVLSIVIGAGSYSLTGQDIILLRPIQTITHDGGAYDLTGNAVEFRKYGYGEPFSTFFAQNENRVFATLPENQYFTVAQAARTETASFTAAAENRDFTAKPTPRTQVQRSTDTIRIRNTRRS